ncbi:MAG: hypothetical protein J1F25_02520 [Prevotellaceae bacterium]|nr:hypothetical protein [Prevotellaceae bacterium]
MEEKLEKIKQLLKEQESEKVYFYSAVYPCVDENGDWMEVEYKHEVSEFTYNWDDEGNDDVITAAYLKNGALLFDAAMFYFGEYGTDQKGTKEGLTWEEIKSMRRTEEQQEDLLDAMIDVIQDPDKGMEEAEW